MFREQTFESAASKFRSVVITELTMLKPKCADMFIKSDTIHYSFQKIETAANEFYFYVEKSESTSFVNSLSAFSDFYYGIKAAKPVDVSETHLQQTTDLEFVSYPFETVIEFENRAFQLLRFTNKKSFGDRIQNKLKRLPDLVEKLKKCNP